MVELEFKPNSQFQQHIVIAKMSDLQELAGISEIGCGYNVNGDYANTLELKIPMFNLYKNGETTVTLDPQNPSGSTFRIPSSVTFHRANTTSYEFASGESSTELCNSLNAKTKLEGSYGPFSASVSVDFGSDEMSTTFYTFSRVQYNINLYTLQLGTASQVKALLTDDARNDINHMAPEKLFRYYGCYYLASFVMGGRSVMGSSTSKYGYEATNSLNVVAETSLSFLIGSTSGSVGTELKEDVKNFQSSSKSHILTKGGDPEFGSQLPDKFPEWSRSVTRFPLLVDFLDASSLRGIWDLADTPSRAQELKTAALKYLAENSDPISQHDGPVLQAKWLPLEKVGFYKQQDADPPRPLSVWRPRLGSGDQGWFYVCPTPFADNSNHSHDTGLAVREIVKGVLGDVSSWDKIWFDYWIGTHALWSPVPASLVNYVPVGNLWIGGDFTGVTPIPPNEEQAARFKVVHKSFVQKGSVGDPIWKNVGYLTPSAVWKIEPASSKLPGFIGTASWDKPTGHTVYAIRDDAVAAESHDAADMVRAHLEGMIRKFASKDFGPQFVDAGLAPGATPAAFVSYVFDKTAARRPLEFKGVPLPDVHGAQRVGYDATPVMPSA